MPKILMDAFGLECLSQQLLAEGANIEAFMESVLALILLDFLGEGLVVEEMRVIVTTASARQPAQYRLLMQASSSNTALALPIELLEARLEEAICCALLEHFDTVVINAIDVHP